MFPRWEKLVRDERTPKDVCGEAKTREDRTGVIGAAGDAGAWNGPRLIFSAM